MNTTMRNRTVFVMILALLVLGSCIPGIALAQTTATFTGLGAGESIYTRYYSRYTPAQVFNMNVGGITYPGFCIDLFTTISVGNILVVNGPLSEDIRDQVDWCAVNYILNTYAAAPTLTNLEAASIQSALWYLTTEPYGIYQGTGGRYQFMSDPTITTPYDAYRQSLTPRDAVRTRAFQILNSVPRDSEGKCTFRFPVNVTLIPVTQDTSGGGTVPLVATVYDQHGDPLEDISVNFYHDSSGTLNPSSGTTNATGQIPLEFTAPVGSGHAHIMADVRGNYGTLLYDPGGNRQSVTTISLLPGSISANASVFYETIPSIMVEKLISTDNVSFTHADTTPIDVLEGYPVYYKLVVTNDGNVNLTNIQLDDTLYAPTCTPPDPLQPGESFTCYYGPVTAVLGTQCNYFTANATPQGGGNIVEDTDRACYDPSPTYNKSGTVYYDNNGNGQQDPGEPGIPDLTMWLCTNCGNTYPCSTVNITKTNETGFYEFSLLTPGPYVVSVPAITDGDTTDFNEQLYAMANPVLVPPVVYSNDPVPRTCIFFDVIEEDHPDNNFGFFRWLYVTGYKYLDANRNGKRDSGEQGLQDFMIRVYNETQLYGSTVSSPVGYYQLLIKNPGNYTVNELQISGWQQTEPASGKFQFTAVAATNQTQNFGNYQILNPCNCPTQASFTHKALTTPKHTIQFTDTSTGYPVSWVWKFGDGKTSISRNPKHTYSRKGTFTVTLAVMSYDCAGKSRWSYYTKKVSVP